MFNSLSLSSRSYFTLLIFSCTYYNLPIHIREGIHLVLVRRDSTTRNNLTVHQCGFCVTEHMSPVCLCPVHVTIAMGVIAAIFIVVKVYLILILERTTFFF